MSIVREKAIEKAAHQANDYLKRQLHKLRYPMIFVVGSMAAFSLYQGDWIPFLSLNVFSLCLVVFSYVLLILFLGKSFLELIIVNDPKTFDELYKQYNIIVAINDETNSKNGESIKEHESVKELDVILKEQLQQESREEIYKTITRVGWLLMFFCIVVWYWATVSVGSFFIGG